ncbi:hypothetical protein [Varunaivibrio sulfuroxidans]|uniref:Holin (3TMs family) n=1 Tax=Varunaivibrio sulfuroxidans TaxID=1773489 RepID=A0A4V2UNL6_9PROT|nr:hypothetical protein [Varunaivibrio sulfuroxidans]TCS62571.1 hypothetical protein EDD55_105117 [Varunaivibrio sulfuroxidans]WES30760.1 hypothetical protein P3M64_14185 [Varunaivibrio sulfuroxidans]
MSGPDIWDAAKGILATVAPALGAAIGGPFGGIAARTITGAILGAPSDDPKAAAAAIAGATPQQLVALKKAESDFAAHMRELDIEMESLAARDRDSARQRQVETKDKMPALIALAALAGFFGILGAMIFVPIPSDAMQPLAIMLGALGTLVTQIGAYYFGSSSGSSRKNAMIERLMAGSKGGA